MRPAFDQGEVDERGRIILRMGGKCPVCGADPDWKVSENNRVVLYHRPATCSLHSSPRRDETLAVAERRRLL